MNSQILTNAGFFILILIQSASSPEKNYDVVCFKHDRAICCPTSCSKKCHSENQFESATCRPYNEGKMQCINEVGEDIILKQCLENVHEKNAECIITKAYNVTCNNADLNKQGLWRANIEKNVTFLRCEGKKDKKVECIDAEGKRVQCANDDCGFNSYLNEGDICNITLAYDVDWIDNKFNCSEKHWKAPPHLTFVNASCNWKGDELQCTDVDGTKICEKCVFRAFKKNCTIQIAQAYNVDCIQDSKTPICCQETCDWKAPPNFPLNNLTCRMNDGKLECRNSTDHDPIKCEDYQNCGFNRFLERSEICKIIEIINQNKNIKDTKETKCDAEEFSEISENKNNNNNTDIKWGIIVSFTLLIIVCIILGVISWHGRNNIQNAGVV